MNHVPHLHGFCKTLRLPVPAAAPVANQFRTTTDLFRRVVDYYLEVFHDHLEILDHPGWLAVAESLTHRTAKNPSPLYHGFDDLFPNLPSGFRRAAITEASRSWLTYYGTEFRVLDGRHLLLKVSTGASYIYRKVALVQPWVIPAGYATGSPTLVREKSGWEVHIPLFLQGRRDLRPAAELMQAPDTRICAVDIGLNHHAVMTIQNTEGRVLATEFISGARDNHLRKQCLEKSVRLQKETGVIPEGERFAKDLRDKISNLNNNIAHQVSRHIVDFAAEHGAKIIVFEHLGNLRPQKGTRSHRMNQKLGHWVKSRIVEYTRYKALHQGIIVCRVNPKDTSRRCPDCGFLSIERYLPEKPNGVTLARCSNCGIHDVHADWLATRNIGQKFRELTRKPLASARGGSLEGGEV